MWRTCRPWSVLLLAGLALPGAASACTAATNLNAALGSYSPAALGAGVVPAARVAAGLSCTPSVIVLLGINSIKAKFHSNNGFKLKSAAGGVVNYGASADAGATVPFTQDSTVDYMQNNLLNLLGLLGGSSADFPVFVKLKAGATPATGTFTDRIVVTWDWYLCQGIGALFLCVGTPDSGRATTTIDVTLDVSPKGLVVTTAVVATWDPVNGTQRPKDLPGSRRRWTVSAQNPDLVPLDANSIALTVPIARGERVALDGDGTGSGTIIALADGSPASGLTLAYATPASTADDVDFSVDNGATWTFAPVAGDAVSQARVTHVRLRPRGAMAAGSQFSASLPASLP